MHLSYGFYKGLLISMFSTVQVNCFLIKCVDIDSRDNDVVAYSHSNIYEI